MTDRLPSTLPASQFPQMEEKVLQFRVVLPGASTVHVQLPGDSLGGERVPLVAEGDDVFTGSLDAPAPGLHYYWLDVDGQQINDPGSYTYNAYGRAVSGVDIPDPTGLGDVRDVPHGDVRVLPYFARTTGRWREMVVYAPPGYDGSRPLPVLYLQHGMGEDETGWTRQGRLAAILDNLLAEQQIEPFLVVMNSGYALDLPDMSQGIPEGFADGVVDSFADLLLDDVVPFVDEHFATIRDRSARALGGLSMGSRQALAIGLANLGTFAGVAGLSPAVWPRDAENARWTVGDDWVAERLAASGDHRPDLVFLSAGTLEQPFIASMTMLGTQLRGQGVEAVQFVSEGTAHEWLTWRRSLQELAPLLFKD